ncbi:MAG: hypothetical protein P0Y53_20235 [Candidatus Pseudobacter hemicellulosilyticus]|uniref:HTH cro/C1-type domain-containing protein n=1 Tax=Candidatus Pseudobacter hemicellulosilyticus TaxID=3121375 RepID=A0AAJ5WQQ6_9BACT|nr:MAG: hypothetical protein P0Y53_20235 [Pseudobacter sp.]
MESIQYLKGIHPGIVVERELKKRNMQKGPFALSIQEYPQTISAITKGKRSIPTGLALRIEKALGWEEGYLMVLQVYYEIKAEKKKQTESIKPDLKKFSKVLFWDTDISKVNWVLQKKSIINRVMERGSLSEKNEILRFYGKGEVEKVLKTKTSDNDENALLADS